MKKSMLTAALLLSTATYAEEIPLEYQIKSITVTEVKNFKNGLLGNVKAETPVTTPTPEEPKVDRLEQTKKVIAVARDFVALGDAVYTLVTKGRPSNVSTYASIDIVPKDPVTKEIVSAFDLENFSEPIEKKFSIKLRNGYNKVVVQFDYSVIFSYGGSYNGKGKFISSAMIVPGTIKTTFGWDFSSEMKLTGIMNVGTKENPVMAANLTVKYAMKSLFSAFEKSDTIFITGEGKIKAFSNM